MGTNTGNLGHPWVMKFEDRKMGDAGGLAWIPMPRFLGLFPSAWATEIVLRTLPRISPNQNSREKHALTVSLAIGSEMSKTHANSACYELSTNSL
jgi:hypothetical protein